MEGGGAERREGVMYLSHRVLRGVYQYQDKTPKKNYLSEKVKKKGKKTKKTTGFLVMRDKR
jgi:hypothetical protein